MAQKNFLVDLNLNLNQLLQALVENVTALPVENLANQAGRIIYLTRDKHLYKCNGEKWAKILEDNEAKVTLTKDSTGLVYTIKQGETTVGTINIPKDMVVNDGSVVKGTFAQDGSFTENTAGKDVALKLIIANNNKPVYINVKDLANIYTGGATADITVDVSDTGEITATLSQTVKDQLAQIANKVDKVEGKGLSTNDFTTAEKNKLASLRATSFFTSAKLTGNSGSVTLEGFDSGKSVIMQCTKAGEEIIISLIWDAARKQINWAANTKFTADDNVVITAIQY